MNGIPARAFVEASLRETRTIRRGKICRKNLSGLPQNGLMILFNSIKEAR